MEMEFDLYLLDLELNDFIFLLGINGMDFGDFGYF